MKTEVDLYEMNQGQLVAAYLTLQDDLGRGTNVNVDVSKSSLPSTYAECSNKLLNIGKEDYFGSGLVLGIFDLSGRPLISPVNIIDGFCKSTTNAILDEISNSYQLAIVSKPTTERLIPD